MATAKKEKIYNLLLFPLYVVRALCGEVYVFDDGESYREFLTQKFKYILNSFVIHPQFLLLLIRFSLAEWRSRHLA